MNDERHHSNLLWLIIFTLCPPILGLLILVATAGGLLNLVLAASLPSAHPRGACAWVLRLPGGQIEIEMPLSALAQRPSSTHFDRLATATHGFATRGAQELEQILNERRMT